MISRWIFDWRVLIQLTSSVSWSLHQLICRVTGYFKVGLFIYVNSWCLFWLVLLSWWGWPKWEMMLINMGNAPVLMHLSLLFSCNIKYPAIKRIKKKKKKKKVHLEFQHVFWFIFIWKLKQPSTILEIQQLHSQSSVIYARTDNKTIIY